MAAFFDPILATAFACLFVSFSLIRMYQVQRRKEKATQSLLKDLKRQVEGNLNESTQKNEPLTRTNELIFCHSWPIIGKAVQRFWLDLDVLGWRKKWQSRSILLFSPSLFLGIAVGKSTSQPVVTSLIASLIFFIALVSMIYRSAMNKHLKEFKQSLPLAIDAIVRATRSGVPVSNCFSVVANNLPGPMALEFALIDKWLQLGVPLREAMRNSASRIPVEEYRFFVVILIINQDSGGKLSDTLERLSETIRARQELSLKVRAKTSEVRASAIIVACLAPLSLIYMYFNSPNDFQFLLNDSFGNQVLIYAIGSILTGLGIVHTMIKGVIR